MLCATPNVVRPAKFDLLICRNDLGLSTIRGEKILVDLRDLRHMDAVKVDSKGTLRTAPSYLCGVDSATSSCSLFVKRHTQRLQSKHGCSLVNFSLAPRSRLPLPLPLPRSYPRVHPCTRVYDQPYTLSMRMRVCSHPHCHTWLLSHFVLPGPIF